MNMTLLPSRLRALPRVPEPPPVPAQVASDDFVNRPDASVVSLCQSSDGVSTESTTTITEANSDGVSKERTTTIMKANTGEHDRHTTVVEDTIVRKQKEETVTDIEVIVDENQTKDTIDTLTNSNSVNHTVDDTTVVIVDDDEQAQVTKFSSPQQMASALSSRQIKEIAMRHGVAQNGKKIDICNRLLMVPGWFAGDAEV